MEEQRIDTFLGLDVADGGNDKNVIARVDKCDDMYNLEIDSEYIGMDTMVIVGETITRIRDLKAEGKRIQVLTVDKIGVGAGTARRFVELQREQINEKEEPWWIGLDIVGVNVSLPARQEEFLNLRAEIWWRMRKLYEEGRIRQKKHEGLKQDLATARMEKDSRGRIRLEEKKKIKARLHRSPNYGDAASLAFLGALGYTREPRIRILGGGNDL